MKEELRTHLLSKISFPTSSFMYIPLVFEQIGVLFRKFHGGDVEDVDLELLLELVNEGKKNAVQKLVDMNFKLLAEDLQVLFLDIALFIIPARYSRLDDATPILSTMHGISDLKCKIIELQMHCTLSVMDNQLNIHDIFTEYAESIAGKSASHVFQPSLDISGSLHNIDPTRKQYWQNHLRKADPGRVLHLKCLEARSIYIGICSESLHHYHMNDAPLVSCDDQEVHIHVEVGTSAHALFVRNQSVYSNCILDLSGDLSSLVCFATENMQQVALPRCGNNGNLNNLVRLEFRNENETCSTQTRKLTGSSILDFMSHPIRRSTQSMRWLLKPLMFPYEQCPPQLVSNFICSGRMRELRVLILHDFAGILRTDGCPQLEILEVRCNSKERMDVRIDKAPKLKRFVTGCSYHVPFFSIKVRPKKLNKLDLHVKECPQLEVISVDGSFNQVEVDGLLPWKLKRLEVADFGCTVFFPMELVSSSAHQLSKLRSLHLGCTKVSRLQFTREHLGCLPSLEELHLQGCTGIRHLTMDAGCVPNLVCLEVVDCDELQVMEWVVQDMLMEKLETLWLNNLPQLEWDYCDLMRSCEARLQLRKIAVVGCPHVRIGVDVLEASQNLEDVMLSRGGGRALVQKKKMQDMETNNGGADESKVLVALDRWIFSECKLTLLNSIRISDLHDLQEIEGLQHLLNLRCLHLEDMSNLTRLSGAWPATIRGIVLYKCPRLLDVPPIDETPYLYYLHFHKCVSLTSVEVRHSHQIQRLWTIVFEKCESMKAFPMEGHSFFMDEWRKRGTGYPTLRVRGSKFASVQAMQAWLRDAEEGSPLSRAAEEALKTNFLGKEKTKKANS